MTVRTVRLPLEGGFKASPICGLDLFRRLPGVLIDKIVDVVLDEFNEYGRLEGVQLPTLAAVLGHVPGMLTSDSFAGLGGGL